MVNPPASSNEVEVTGAAAMPPTANEPAACPCLISGVAIRRNTVTIQGLGKVDTSKEDSASEVQAMNQVNQALSGDSTPQIISDSSSSSSPSPKPLLPPPSISEKQNPFVPYLLVHDISKPKKGLQPWKGFEKSIDKHTSPSSSSSHSTSVSVFTGTKVSPMVPNVQDFYPIMEIEEEDPDVQILGVSLPNTDNMIKYNGAPSLVPAKANNNNNLSDSGHSTMVVGSTKPSSSTKDLSSSVAVDNNTQFPIRKEGRVVQCLELPPQVLVNQYISSITPTPDNQHIVVVTAPKCLHQSISCLDSVSAATTSSLSPASHPQAVREESPVLSHNDGLVTTSFTSATTNESSMDCSELSVADVDGENSVTMGDQMATGSAVKGEQQVEGSGAGGCLIVYDAAPLQDTPCHTYVIDSIEDTITSVLMLPKEISQSMEEEDLSGNVGATTSDWGTGEREAIDGQIVVTTHRGDIKIIQLSDCKVLATIPAPDRDKFVSVTYCTGMDRLCACTKEGKLHFYVISPRGGPCQEVESDLQAQMSPVRGNGGSGSKEEPMDTNMDHLTRSGKLDMSTKFFINSFKTCSF